MTPLPILALLAVFAEAEFELRIVPSSADDALVRVLAVAPQDEFDALPNGKVASADGRALLQFSVLDENTKPGRPMLGTYTRAANTLTFAPRFALVSGGRYRASLKLPTGKSVTADYRVRPTKLPPPAVVTQVYPTAPVLPANALKFYIHFSKPMRNGRAIFDRIFLLDDTGKVIPDPWRRTELWTADDRRFTLWIHPGRVKKGVNLRDELGPVLEPNRKYALVIERSVQDEVGQPLAKAYRREFRTAAEDRSPLKPRDWSVSSPKPGTRDPLRIVFGKPLDHALLLRCLELRDASDSIVSGKWSTERDDTVSVFHPKTSWRTGRFQLVVDGILEDVAGNTPLRAFDTDLTPDHEGPPAREPVLRVPVRIGP